MASTVANSTDAPVINRLHVAAIIIWPIVYIIALATLVPNNFLNKLYIPYLNSLIIYK